MTQAELIRASVRLEAAGRFWSAHAFRAEALAMKPAAKDEFAPGAELHHRARGGAITATCVYMAPDVWIYDHVSYTTPQAAARAAASKLGLTSVFAWRWFWGVEKREKQAQEA